MTCVFLKLWSTLSACGNPRPSTHTVRSTPIAATAPTFQPPSALLPLPDPLSSAPPTAVLVSSRLGPRRTRAFLLTLCHAVRPTEGRDKVTSGARPPWQIQSECKLCDKRRGELVACEKGESFVLELRELSWSFFCEARWPCMC